MEPETQPLNKPDFDNKPNCCQRLVYHDCTKIILVLIVCALIGIGTPFLWKHLWKTSHDCCEVASDLR